MKRRFRFRPMNRTSFVLCSAASLLGFLPFPSQAQSPSAKGGSLPERTEVFHVRLVGSRGAAETRDTLLELYEHISSDYNRTLATEQAANPQQFKGDRVRVLRELDDGGGGDGSTRFLVAYNGGPSVLSVSGDVKGFEPGKLSPALLIGQQAGEQPVELSRVITVKEEKPGDPQLETLDDDEGEVTFFGIPIPGTRKKPGSGSSEPGTTETVTRRQEITETKQLPHYPATVSTERFDGAPTEMSTELFVNQLKNGEVFSVSREELRRCQNCRGFGRVTTTKPPGFRDPDGKMACPECGEKGKISWQVTYKVTW